ncbi:MAG: hypothetical protein HQ567_26580, partial [Candidatus Nealsonbacteria bacterium]|nr:hypothetical protein [Candidatus Nealsonbacteria bacterium]
APVTGAYTFDGLTSGRYYIQEQVPAGYTQTAGPDFYTFAVVAGEVIIPDVDPNGLDFGNTPISASVGGTKWHDLTGDGFSGDDVRMGGVTIELYADGGDGIFDGVDDVLINTAITADVTGGYTFDQLLRGRYFVQEQVPAGHVQTAGPDYYGFDVSYSTIVGAEPDIQPVVPEFFFPDAMDFGNFRGLVSIGGTKFDDLTGDGFTGDDVPMGGVTIELFLDGGDGIFDGVDDVLIGTQITADVTGTYTFDDLDSGRYYIQEQVPDGFVQTAGPAYYTVEIANGIVSSDDDMPVNDSGFDFGNFEPFSVSGFVYVDINNDGVKDFSELPIPNTTILLSGIDTEGNPISEDTVTDEDGFYIFEGLWPGTYSIKELQPDAYIDGKDTIGTPGGLTTNDQFWNVVMEPGGIRHGVNNNFGERGLKYISKRMFLLPRGLWDDVYDGSSSEDPVEATVIEGTDDDDRITFTPGAKRGTWTVTIGHRDWGSGDTPVTGYRTESGTGPLYIDGLEGDDEITLLGTGGNELVAVGEDYVTIVGNEMLVVGVNTNTITVNARGGTDTLKIYDSPGSDRLRAKLNKTTIEGAGFAHTLLDFELVDAYASSGKDIAQLYDSRGDDMFIARPTRSTMSGDGFKIEVHHFDQTHGYSITGGFDVAKLIDSSGDDLVVARPTYATMYGDKFYSRAKLFDQVHSYSINGGYDIAKLIDSPGDDYFQASPTQGILSGNDFYSRAKYFDEVHAYALSGGNDRADFADSAGDDVFTGTPIYGALRGDGFYNRAKFFEQIEATSTGGNDRAELQPEGDALLEAADGWARLSFGEMSRSVSGFNRVTAQASADGESTKQITAHDFILTLEGVWLDL